MNLQSLLKRITSGISRFSSRLFVTEPDESVLEFVAVLRETDLFKTLTRRQLMKVAPSFHRRHYKRNEVIYYEGDPGLGLYVVEEGVVSTTSESGNEIIIGTDAKPYQSFGIVSMFGDVRRSETATASTQASVLGLFTPELKSLVRRNPAIGASVLQVLAEFLAETHSTNSKYQTVSGPQNIAGQVTSKITDS